MLAIDIVRWGERLGWWLGMWRGWWWLLRLSKRYMMGLEAVHGSHGIRRVVHVRVTFDWDNGGRHVNSVVVVHIVV
jgi:hypothetical protein